MKPGGLVLAAAALLPAPAAAGAATALQTAPAVEAMLPPPSAPSPLATPRSLPPLRPPQNLLVVGQCQVELFAPWTRAGRSAAAPGGGTIALVSVPSEQMVIELLGPGFVPVERGPARLVFARDLPGGGRQFRSVTRGAGGCAVDVNARAAVSVAAGRAIADSIARAQ